MEWERPSPERERAPTPVGSDDDDPSMSYDQAQKLASGKRKSKKSTPKSDHPITTRIRLKPVIRDRRVPNQYPRNRYPRMRAELEARDRRSIQGQRIRVCHLGTLLKPES
jgi:hypothetical protein